MIVSDNEEFSYVESDDGLDEHGMKYMYRDSTWMPNSFEYWPR
jgi:hypothetical protein